MENKKVDQETTGVYRGKLFDVVVVNQQLSDPKKIQRLIDPAYQEKMSRETVARMFERYGETFEQLKNL